MDLDLLDLLDTMDGDEHAPPSSSRKRGHDEENDGAPAPTKPSQQLHTQRQQAQAQQPRALANSRQQVFSSAPKLTKAFGAAAHATTQQHQHHQQQQQGHHRAISSGSALFGVGNGTAPNPSEGYKCRFSGLNIIRPAVASLVVAERLKAMTYIPLRTLADAASSRSTTAKRTVERIENGTTQSYAFIGVCHEAARPTESSSGKAYGRWRLTDLAGNHVTLFVFGDAQRSLRLDVDADGGVYMVQSAKVYRKEPGDSNIAYSVDDASKVTRIGKSRDFGRCKAIRRQDEKRCGMPVNISGCAYCEYHVGQAHKEALKKASSRPEMRLSSALSKGVVGMGPASAFTKKPRVPDPTPIPRKVTSAKELVAAAAAARLPAAPARAGGLSAGRRLQQHMGLGKRPMPEPVSDRAAKVVRQREAARVEQARAKAKEVLASTKEDASRRRPTAVAVAGAVPPKPKTTVLLDDGFLEAAATKVVAKATTTAKATARPPPAVAAPAPVSDPSAASKQPSFLAAFAGIAPTDGKVTDTMYAATADAEEDADLHRKIGTLETRERAADKLGDVHAQKVGDGWRARFVCVGCGNRIFRVVKELRTAGKVAALKERCQRCGELRWERCSFAAGVGDGIERDLDERVNGKLLARGEEHGRFLKA